MRITNDRTGWRHEYKYLCDACQAAVLRARAEDLLQRDLHVNEDGVYRIRSLYLDGINDSCYWENENGTDERAKFRIRIYNEDPSYIMLEKKSKKHGMTRKESCRISKDLCEEFLYGRIPDIDSGMEKDLKLLLAEIQYKVLKPAVIVQYDRYPYVEENGNVRVTFDRDISSSCDFDAFFEPYIVSRPILKTKVGILEVKWDSHLPEYIKEYLQLDTLQWSTFSKYYLCRKYNCHGGSIL